MIDIALLKLGENISGDDLDHQFAEERVDLSVFSPVCLPNIGESFLGQNGNVYGEQHQAMKVFLPLSYSPGWGDTGLQETSTDKLQEAVVPIVQSSECTMRMNQTEGVNEDLIVCAGGDESGGPCKVNLKLTVCSFLNNLYLGRQWWATHNRK